MGTPFGKSGDSRVARLRSIYANASGGTGICDFRKGEERPRCGYSKGESIRAESGRRLFLLPKGRRSDHPCAQEPSLEERPIQSVVRQCSLANARCPVIGSAVDEP